MFSHFTYLQWFVLQSTEVKQFHEVNRIDGIIKYRTPVRLIHINTEF